MQCDLDAEFASYHRTVYGKTDCPKARIMVYISADMHIPGYVLLEKVGEGAGAEVWKARQESLDRIVAIKLRHSVVAEDQDEASAFIHEARTAAALSNPHIIGIYDIQSHDGQDFIAMEFVDGDTLGELVRRQGPLSADMALKVAYAVASALDHAWARARMIHCDIKPDNIMLDKSGTVKVADLGIARTRHESSAEREQADGEIRGTPNYMAPEQITGHPPLDSRTDMYALGATLYHILTGIMPFGGDSASRIFERQVHDRLPSPCSLQETIPESLAHFIAKLMMKRQEDRFDSWRDVQHALKKAQRHHFFLPGNASDKGTVLLDPRKPSPPSPRGHASTSAKPRTPIISPPPSEKRSSPPQPLRMFLWLALVAWLGCLTFIRLPETPTSDPAPQTATSQIQPDHMIHEDPVEPVDVVSVTEESDTTPPEAAAPESSASDQEQLDSVLENVCNHLVAGNLPQARATLARELGIDRPESFHNTIIRAQELIGRAARVDEVLAARFRARVGEEITLHHNGRSINLILRAVAGNMLSTERLTSNGVAQTTQRLAVPINKLEPAEKARWLGGDDRPAFNLMRFLLFYRAGDYTEAARHAEGCGPLSKALSDITAQRRGNSG